MPHTHTHTHTTVFPYHFIYKKKEPTRQLLKKGGRNTTKRTPPPPTSFHPPFPPPSPLPPHPTPSLRSKHTPKTHTVMQICTVHPLSLSLFLSSSLACTHPHPHPHTPSAPSRWTAQGHFVNPIPSVPSRSSPCLYPSHKSRREGKVERKPKMGGKATARTTTTHTPRRHHVSNNELRYRQKTPPRSGRFSLSFCVVVSENGEKKMVLSSSSPLCALTLRRAATKRRTCGGMCLVGN